MDTVRTEACNGASLSEVNNMEDLKKWLDTLGHVALPLAKRVALIALGAALLLVAERAEFDPALVAELRARMCSELFWSNPALPHPSPMVP